ncbi:PfkB family carbohydrate kinase [Pseudotabrizicola alkalilacus]|uniref:Fructoselysine 6-kinase n=1 Tax=Pseudotabrizicola alkalilacus TaxID=2305252 RepID=A0A411YWJ6_9RHOB|nr:PfkB family carbohydrate kinase [Pseudotabrizicola alkalilacus]RGP35261.1 fructoselysine 6-kinase [Pseudotabrizicola alkalilacus]
MTGPLMIAVGDNCLDVYLTRNQLAVGGNALNVAVQWRNLGLRVRYMGVVGPDAEGDTILAAIAKAGLDPADCERRPGHSAVTLLQDRLGDRRFLLEDLGVGLHYMPGVEGLAALAQADWVHLGTNSSPTLLRYLLDAGLNFSVDLSTAYATLDLAGVPLVFASGPEDNAQPVSPLIDGLLARGAQRAVVTCGRRGAYYHDGFKLHQGAAQPITVVDTCGAGDSFIATFLADHMIGGQPAPEALRRATMAAAVTCMHEGGFPQGLGPIPDWLLQKYAGVIASAEV